MPRTLYHERQTGASRWYPFPAYKPLKKGRYIVNFRRPTAGRWIAICRWDGQSWDRNADVIAWMVQPKRYKNG